MDFSLTSDQILIRDTVRQFMETEIRPILREYEREEKFPAEQLKKLGELGCCGMLVPEEWGGSGTDTVSYALMLEEVARVDASTAVALSVTNSVVAIPLWKAGSEAQKKKYLTRLSRGEILGAFCFTEPQARLRCRRHSGPCHAQRRSLHPQRHQSLGHQWRRLRRLHRLCEDRSRRRQPWRHRLSRRTGFSRIPHQPLRR